MGYVGFTLSACLSVCPLCNFSYIWRIHYNCGTHHENGCCAFHFSYTWFHIKKNWFFFIRIIFILKNLIVHAHYSHVKIIFFRSFFFQIITLAIFWNYKFWLCSNINMVNCLTYNFPDIISIFWKSTTLIACDMKVYDILNFFYEFQKFEFLTNFSKCKF